jgi:Aldehyde dehydrogenase family
MTDSPTITTYRWSSDRSEDRFTVENPATGQTITVVQGGGVPEVDAAVRAAHRAFQDNWRWRSLITQYGGRYLVLAAGRSRRHHRVCLHESAEGLVRLAGVRPGARPGANGVAAPAAVRGGNR